MRILSSAAQVGAAALLVGAAAAAAQSGRSGGKPERAAASAPAAYASVPVYKTTSSDGFTPAQVKQITAARKATDEDLLNQRSWGYQFTEWFFPIPEEKQAAPLREMLALEISHDNNDPWQDTATWSGQNLVVVRRHLGPKGQGGPQGTLTFPFYKNQAEDRFNRLYSPYAADEEQISRDALKAMEEYRIATKDPDFPPELQPRNLSRDVVSVKIAPVKDAGPPVGPYEAADDLVVDETYTQETGDKQTLAHRVVRYAPRFDGRASEIIWDAPSIQDRRLAGLKWTRLDTAGPPQWYLSEIAWVQGVPISGIPPNSVWAYRQDITTFDPAKAEPHPLPMVYPWKPGVKQSRYVRLPPDLATKPGNHQKD